jgi:acetolactate synthase regulatory subunit
MHWTYQITAASQPRVLPRLVRLFEQQPLVIRAVDLALLDRSVKISISVDAEPELARHLQARLYHQDDVQHVELLAGPPAATAPKKRPAQRV